MSKLYLAFVAVFIQLVAFSQTDIVIGTGTTGNGNLNSYPAPLQDYYEGSRMQYLYLASELTAAGMTPGNISAIKFEVITLNGLLGSIEQFKLSIGSTTTASLTDNTWETGLVDVFGPVDLMPTVGTNTFTFTTPFLWNGTDNIVVEVCNGDPLNGTYVSYTENATVPWTTGLSFNGSHNYRADNLGNLCGSATTTNTGTQTTRPNITFEWTPSSTTGCYLPSGIAFANVTATGASATWNPPASGSTPVQYMWELRTSGAAGSGATGLAASGSTATTAATFSSLTPITTYQFYIMTDCGTGNMSIWSAAYPLTTGCAAVTSLNQNFDAVTTPALPQCWSKILRGASIPTAAYVQTATGNAFSTPNSVSLYNSSATSGDDIILVSPQLSNVGAGTHRLTFYAKNSAATEDIEVGTLSDNSATATFTSLEVVDISTTYTKYTVSFANYAGTDQYIGIRMLNSTTFSNVYIDNVVWEPIPSCEVPTGVMHTNVDSASAQISWTAPAITSPIGYHIYYSTSSTPPTASTTATDSVAAATTYLMDTLIPATVYYVWVRSNCGGGDVSVWTVVDSFYTASPIYAWVTVTGFNADVIADGIGSAAASTTSDVDNVNYVFVSSDFQYDPSCAYPTRSLPLSRQIYYPSLGMYFSLAPYNGDNDLRLMTTDVGTLTFGSPLTAEKVYLLTTSGSGASKVSVIVNFQDGSTQTFDSLDISDWYGSTTNMVVGGIGRTLKTTATCGGLETSTTNPKLYQTVLSLDSANFYKRVSSVTISRIDGITGFGGVVNVLAVSVKKGGLVLPVTLSDFKGYRTEGGNKLEWSTASEAENTGFELQRSADGKNFSKISFVASKAPNGNSSFFINYGFTDAKPFAGTAYYRLKQINKDGRFNLSNIVSIRGTRTNTVVMSAAYPNPAKSKLNVVLNAPSIDKVTMILTDLAGKVVMQQQAQLLSGDNNLTLNIGSLPSGSYMIKAVCSSGCETAVSKIVKQ